MIRGDEMKCQRGSVTVISLAMLLFLMVVAVAWLPMMTMEKTAAASDYREQQAWYAAEAGYKRAVAQLEAGNSKWSWLSAAGGLTGEGNFGFSPNPSSLDLEKVNQDGVWYAVSIVDADEDILDGYKPKEGTVYTITAVGSYNGIRKVIRKEYTLGDNGGTGGGDEGGEETLKLPGLVQAGGKVTFANDGTGAIDGNIYVSDSGKVEDKTNGGDGGYTDGKIYADKELVHGLKTLIPNSVFEENSYENLQEVIVSEQWDKINLASNTNYLINWPLPYNWGYLIDGTKANGSTLFVHSNQAININTTDGILGLTSGKPLTLVFDNEVVLNGIVKGNIRIFVKKSFTFGGTGNDGDNNLFMIMANNNIFIQRPIKYGFLSSHQNIDLTYKQYFYGQIQAAGNVYVASPIYYSNKVLASPGFTIPQGMK